MDRGRHERIGVVVGEGSRGRCIRGATARAHCKRVLGMSVSKFDTASEEAEGDSLFGTKWCAVVDLLLPF